MTAYLRLLILAPLIAAGLLAGGALPAAASCAVPPQKSAHAFTGTVVSTERDGRVAKVRTEDGRRVVVRGTPSEGGITSVDRTYRVGGRYEFHPINRRSPYEDNACTATRLLSQGPAGDEDQSGVAPAAYLAGGIMVLLLGGGFALWVLRRRRSAGPVLSPPASPA